MENHVKHMALLRRMFTEHEWQHLLANSSFTLRLHNAEDTLDAVERLSILGEELIQLSRVACDKVSADPARHGGPFKTLSIKQTESGIIANEECVACGGPVRRITLAMQAPAQPPHQQPSNRLIQ